MRMRFPELEAVALHILVLEEAGSGKCKVVGVIGDG